MTKNLVDSFLKTTILAVQWSFERSLMLKKEIFGFSTVTNIYTINSSIFFAQIVLKADVLTFQQAQTPFYS